MSDIPHTINPLATLVNKIISGLVEGVAEPVLETMIEADVPFLGLPVVKQLFEYAFHYIIHNLDVQMEVGAVKFVINIQTDSELAQAITAAIRLRDAMRENNQHAIDEASKDLDAAYDNLGHFDGWAKPN
jgi:hypothetical protein